MPLLASTANTTRTNVTLTRRCAAMPVQTPAISRPSPRRINGGRVVSSAVPSVLTRTSITPRRLRWLRINPGAVPEPKFRVGAVPRPDVVRSPYDAQSAHDRDHGVVAVRAPDHPAVRPAPRGPVLRRRLRRRRAAVAPRRHAGADRHRRAGVAQRCRVRPLPGGVAADPVG